MKHDYLLRYKMLIWIICFSMYGGRTTVGPSSNLWNLPSTRSEVPSNLTRTPPMGPRKEGLEKKNLLRDKWVLTLSPIIFGFRGIFHPKWFRKRSYWRYSHFPRKTHDYRPFRLILDPPVSCWNSTQLSWFNRTALPQLPPVTQKSQLTRSIRCCRRR